MHGRSFSQVVDGEKVTYYASPEECEFHEHADKLLTKHLGGTLGLQAIEFNPIAREDQRLAVTHRRAAPHASLAGLRYLGNAVLGEERLAELEEAFLSRPDLLNNRRMDLARGMNIGTITNHSALHDIAVVQAVELLALKDESLISRSATMLSKLITRLEVNIEGLPPLPTTDVADLTGASFLSIPRTKSIYRSRMSNNVAELTNPHMLLALQEWLSTGGKRLAIAPSGSIDELEDGVLHLQRMSSGTANTISLLDRVLQVAINLDAQPGERWFSIGDYTDQTHNKPDESHKLMESIAVELSVMRAMPVEYEQERLRGKDLGREIFHKIIEKAENTVDRLRTD
jgi:hypothetical protein